jgi:hypothetical protein
MRPEEVLHRQREQRAEALYDLLARHVWAKPAGLISRAFAEVGERVAGDDSPRGSRSRAPCRSASVPGTRLDSDRQPLAGRIRARLTLVLAEQPDQVGAPVAGLLGGEAVRPHEIFRRVGQRRVDRHAEPLDQALRVALMPRRGEHDRRLAAAVRASISLGTASGSKSKSRSPSSIA